MLRRKDENLRLGWWEMAQEDGNDDNGDKSCRCRPIPTRSENGRNPVRLPHVRLFSRPVARFCVVQIMTFSVQFLSKDTVLHRNCA
mmetsp:Transcript_843/g.1870  ORF Transcript_843/g.1870 Transcript_843/m.1870 type:complete len:86 (-) Transcript_843:60-317(-)